MRVAYRNATNNLNLYLLAADQRPAVDGLVRSWRSVVAKCIASAYTVFFGFFSFCFRQGYSSHRTSDWSVLWFIFFCLTTIVCFCYFVILNLCPWWRCTRWSENSLFLTWQNIYIYIYIKCMHVRFDGEPHTKGLR